MSLPNLEGIIAWLYTVPEIPLERGVPVVCVDTGERGVVSRVDCKGMGEHTTEVTWFDRGDPEEVRSNVMPHVLRVDLSSDLGFVFALRWYGHQPVLDDGGLFVRLRDGYLLTPNEADRLDLAPAMAAAMAAAMVTP